MRRSLLDLSNEAQRSKGYLFEQLTGLVGNDLIAAVESLSRRKPRRSPETDSLPSPRTSTTSSGTSIPKRTKIVNLADCGWSVWCDLP